MYCGRANISFYVMAIAVLFLCIEKNEKTSLPELRVCLASYKRDWIQRLHSFRENLKYAEELLLYPEGDLKTSQGSSMVGQFDFL